MNREVDINNSTSYPSPTNYISKEEVLKEYNNLIETIKKTKDKKIWDFELLYQILIDNLYMLEDPILIRHFLLVTIIKINNELTKNNKPYRINFSDNTYNQFVVDNVGYYKKNNLNNDGNTLNINKIRNHLDYLNKLVTTFTGSDELYLKLV